MRRRAGLTCALLVLTATGCSAPDALSTRSASHTARADDGLLANPELQRVVEAAALRDGAAVRAAFTAPDPAVRARAAFAMATLRDIGAAPELRALLSDPDPRVRSDAAFALAHYSGAGDAGDQMSDLLARETDRGVRSALIDALGKAGYSRSLGVLLTLDGDDRVEATLALSRAVIRGAGPAGAIDTLVARLLDPEPEVRRNAAYFLERIDDPSKWINFRRPIRIALDAMPPDDLAAMSIVEGLGGRFDVFSLPRIVYRARNAVDWRVRVNAMAGLEGMGEGEDKLLTLIEGLEDPSHHVRATAAATLATSPPDPDVQAVLVAWAEEHPDDVAALVTVLTLLAQAGDAEPLLNWVRELSTDDEPRWTAAIPALAQTAGEEPLTELARAASSSSVRLARAAAQTLVQRVEETEEFAGPAASAAVLSRAITTAHPQVAGDLALALLRRRGEGVDGMAALARIWEELGGRDGPGRRASIRAALEREGALEALAALSSPPGPGRGEIAPRGGGGEEDDAVTPSPFDLDWAALAELGPRPVWGLETDIGTITIELAADQAPLTVQRMARLARSGRFDGVPFHRVIANFVAQAGDLSRGASPLPPAGPLRTEITRIPFERGVIGMANIGSLDTESSQFFITHDRKPHLDGGYTSFGWVIDGMDVVDRLQSHHRIQRTWVRVSR